MNKPGSQQRNAAGFSLVEVLIATLILLAGLAAMMNIFMLGAGLNISQGEVFKRVTQYAQDKMEQVLALGFLDATTDTTVYPQGTSGTGLGGAMAANTTVPAGGIVLNSPVTGYTDYLDASGNLLSNSTGAFYVRQWSIATGASTTLKTITVTVTTTQRVGLGKAPSVTLVSYKTQLQ